MAHHRKDIIDALRELAELTTLDEGSPQSFRVRAYENAARALETTSVNIEEATESALATIDGVGKSTAKKIKELRDSGRLAKLTELRKKYPPSVVALSKVPGVGPKAVAKLRKELGVEDVAALKAAAEQGRIRVLAGMGEKTEQKILRALERLGNDVSESRMPISRALPLARRLEQDIAQFPGVTEVQACGSLRRVRETVGDLDIVVATTEPAQAIERFVALSVVDSVLLKGDTRVSVLTPKGLQIDLRAVEPAAFGAACLYFTGSKAHNIKLRQRALSRGWVLNEYGLSESESGAMVARETEASIYEALDLAFIPPPLREDTGEIEAAEKGELPRSLSASDLRGDLHVHTDLSGDGQSPFEAMIEAAEERGYEYLALTEHAVGLPMQGVDKERLLDQRRAIRSHNEQGRAMLVLHGCELNIGPDGELDYDDEFRQGFDWLLASVHTHFDLSRDRQTQRILAAMQDPNVHMIGHLSARTIGRRPGIELDMDAVLETAAKTRTILEINAGLSRLDVSAEVLRRSKDFPEVVFALTSDAHRTDEYGRVDFATQHVLRGWLDPDRIANTWPRERFLAWVEAR